MHEIKNADDIKRLFTKNGEQGERNKTKNIYRASNGRITLTGALHE